jgi:hypothetical protein|tara:strand:+ start:155 stop:670 length:516 start_codon:yes stop_codon:yes gene_type:complete
MRDLLDKLNEINDDIVQEKVGRLRYEPDAFDISQMAAAKQAVKDGLSEEEFLEKQYAEAAERTDTSVEDIRKLWTSYEPRNRQFKEQHYGSVANRLRAFYQNAKGSADFDARDAETYKPKTQDPDPKKLSLSRGSLNLGAIDPSTLRPARSAQGRPTVDVKVNRRRPPNKG